MRCIWRAYKEKIIGSIKIICIFEYLILLFHLNVHSGYGKTPSINLGVLCYIYFMKFDVKKYLEDIKKLRSNKKITPRDKVDLYNKSNSKGCNC